MYEDMTSDVILEQFLASFPQDIDTREGSIAHDTVAAMAVKVAELYVAIDNCFDLTSLELAEGEYLDRFATDHGVARLPATQSVYRLIYKGEMPNDGEEFYDESGDFYYTTRIIDGEAYLVSQETGIEQNYIKSGTSAIPLDYLSGTENTAFGEIVTYAIDEETDEALRLRIKNKISGMSENGNASQYKTWCESIPGVGRATIYPLKYGPNTVAAVLVSPEGLPVTQSVVNDVQVTIDPKNPAYLVDNVELGTGHGEGLAPIGAHFVAMSATKEDIYISLSIELAQGFVIDDARNQITADVTNYLKQLTLDAEDNKTVRYTRISALIANISSVFDYSDLKINGNTKNITISDIGVPVLAEVRINVAVQ